MSSDESKRRRKRDQSASAEQPQTESKPPEPTPSCSSPTPAPGASAAPTSGSVSPPDATTSPADVHASPPDPTCSSSGANDADHPRIELQPDAPALLRWAVDFLPHYFTDQPAQFHAELMADLADGDRLLARVAPRGHAKSTCAALAYPLWCICERKRRNIVVITHELALATQFVRDIRLELESNERIIARYGNLCADANAPAAPANAPTQKKRQPAARKPAKPEFPTGEKSIANAGTQPPKTKSTRKPLASKGTAARARPSTSHSDSNRRASASPKARTQARTTPQDADASLPTFPPSHVPTPAPSSPHVDNAAPPRPAARRRKWTDSLLITANGVAVQARSTNASFRGVRVGPHRPDLIICDDIEKDEHVETPAGRARLDNWLRRVVLPALAPDGRVVVLGSLIHHDSLLANLRDPVRFPRWNYRVYRAYEPRPRPAGGFELVSLWPSRWPIERLHLERERIGTLAFEQEYMSSPVDTSRRVFRPEWLRRYDPATLIGRPLVQLIAIDPATGTAGGDFFALWVGSIDTETGVIYTRELSLERIGIVDQIKRIRDAARRWRPLRIGVETTAYQVSLKQILDDLSRRNGDYLPLVPMPAITNKRARIEGATPFFENGTFLLPPTLDPEAEAQFLQFPKARHDDAPDVCAMAIELARGVRSGLPTEALTRPGRNGLRRDMW